MKKNLLTTFIYFFLFSTIAFSTTLTVTNAGFTFSPNTLTINLGDSVNFVLGGSHDADEVSQSTWTVNGTTNLAGGFLTPFGGGLVLPANLQVGTHWYVCSNHAGSGMKAIITVNPASGISGDNNQKILPSIYPNPSTGQFILNNTSTNSNYEIEIYDVLGKHILNQNIIGEKQLIDLSNQTNGVYFIKMKFDSSTITKRIIIQNNK